MRRALVQDGSLPWWTPYYMSGSSYGLHHAQGLYLVPGLALSFFFDPLASLKLTALAAIFSGAVAMYFCALHFVRSEWGAALAALVFLLHPEQLIRAAGTEHLGVSVFLPFVPLSWLFFARALESGRRADALWCAAAVALGMWAHNKMAFVNLLFLAAYAAYWVAWGRGGAPGAGGWRSRALLAGRSCALITAASLCLGAFFIVPGLAEARHVKLFEGEPIREWQRSYAFKSLFALVDRDGAVTRQAIGGVLERVNARGGARGDREVDRVRRVVAMQTDSPEKYAGLVLLALLALAALANRRRENRPLFWFLAAAFAASVMLAYGPASVWGANVATWSAAVHLEGLPAAALLAAWLAPPAAAALALLAWRRKLTTPRRQLVAGIALAAFLFVPAFPLVSWLPFYGEIRAPYAFYDVSGTFLGALLSGFFVTDVLRSRAPLVVAAVALLMLADYAPYQQPTRDNGVPARTLANLRQSYGSLRADEDAVKVYALSGRVLRLLGPMLGGKPLAYEAFYNWMAPKGIGYLNTQARGEPALFDLLGARYIVFDKSDPRMAHAGKLLQGYRSRYPVHREDDDFVVFRNPGARSYLGAFAQAVRFEGDAADSVALTLALSELGWPLVHAGAAASGPFESVYRPGEPSPLPPRQARQVALQVETLVRENAGTIRAVLSAEEPSWLVVNESYYPYWRAALDGNSAELYRASTGLMALRLPAGRHQLELRYAVPRSYLLAALLSALTLAAALAAAWLERRRRRRAAL